MHTSQTTHPFTKLHCNFVCFDPYGGFWLPSNLEILRKIYKSVSTPKPVDIQWPFGQNVTRCPSLCWHCVTIAEALSYLKEKGTSAFSLLLKLKASSQNRSD